jgi:hypothetical protein
LPYKILNTAELDELTSTLKPVAAALLAAQD